MAQKSKIPIRSRNPREAIRHAATDEEQQADAQLYKLRIEFDKNPSTRLIQMFPTDPINKMRISGTINGHSASIDSPLILLGSGAARSACGLEWDKWRFSIESLSLKMGENNFGLEKVN